MRINVIVSKRKYRQLQEIALDRGQTCESLAADILGEFLRHQDGVPEPEPPAPVQRITSASLSPDRDLAVEFGDGRSAHYPAAEVPQWFGAITACEVAVGGGGVFLTSTDGDRAFYPSDFFWFMTSARPASERGE